MISFSQAEQNPSSKACLQRSATFEANDCKNKILTTWNHRFYEMIVTKFYLECWTSDKVSNSVPESYLVPVLGHNFQVEIKVGTPQRRIQPTCNKNLNRKIVKPESILVVNSQQRNSRRNLFQVGMGLSKVFLQDLDFQWKRMIPDRVTMVQLILNPSPNTPKWKGAAKRHPASGH